MINIKKSITMKKLILIALPIVGMTLFGCENYKEQAAQLTRERDSLVSLNVAGTQTIDEFITTLTDVENSLGKITEKQNSYSDNKREILYNTIFSQNQEEQMSPKQLEFLFSLKDRNIDFYPLPTKYNKLLGYAKNESEYFWMSYNDSLSSLIKLNKRQNEISIYYDSILLDVNQVIGFGLKNDKPEIALRNPLKNNIIIYTFSDTVADVRLVRFPIFYQSFSLPALGYIKNNNGGEP